MQETYNPYKPNLYHEFYPDRGYDFNYYVSYHCELIAKLPVGTSISPDARPTLTDEAQAWLDATLPGRYTIGKIRYDFSLIIILQNERDALAFKMRWG